MKGMLRDILALRPKSFAVLAVLALANLALVLYLSLWQKPELVKAQQEWFAKRQAAASGADVSQGARYQKGVKDLETFRKRLIPKDEFAAFLSELFASAKSNSLAIKGITYKPPQGKEQELMSYGVSFSVSGKYAAVKSFVADLVRWPELVTLDSISLASASPTEELVDLKVQMTVYLKKEGA